MSEPFVVLDVEVVHSPDEPGYSWSDPHALGLAVACTWSEADGCRDWYANDVGGLVTYLCGFPRVVTFNGVRFDLPALGPEFAAMLKGKTIDLFADLHKASGQMLSLDRVARGTLGRGKSGKGEDAPKMWAAGKCDQVVAYCRADVEITREIYLAGLRGRSICGLASAKKKAWNGYVRWSLR